MKEYERQTAMEDCIRMVAVMDDEGLFYPAIHIRTDEVNTLIDPNTMCEYPNTYLICGRGDWLERYAEFKIAVSQIPPKAVDSSRSYQIDVKKGR